MTLLPRSFGSLGDFEPAFLILGPCAFESTQHCLAMAEAIAKLQRDLNRLVIFKVSFDKANRTRRGSYRGRGLDEALRAFYEIRKVYSLPVLTDVHEAWQCSVVAPHVDALQIPAFLSRQTDLLEAAGSTGLPVNIKKGQFLSAEDMRWAADKVRSNAGRPIACERGPSFAYRDLVYDVRGLATMRRECTAPVVFDATHSAQKPGGAKGSTSGDRSVVLDLTRAAIAIGIDGLFLETHENPAEALSDSATMVPLAELKTILTECLALDDFAKSQLRQRDAKNSSIPSAIIL